MRYVWVPSSIRFLAYYFFPLALVTQQFGLMLNIFFLILFGMLLGLVLLSLNVENLLEHGLTFLLLFWENAACRLLILKNLVAHRGRNRKTTIMYAMSLGFIIFIAVSFAMQIQSATYQQLQRGGAKFKVLTQRTEFVNRPDLMVAFETIARNEPMVERFGWMTHFFKDFSKCVPPSHTHTLSTLVTKLFAVSLFFCKEYYLRHGT